MGWRLRSGEKPYQGTFWGMSFTVLSLGWAKVRRSGSCDGQKLLQFDWVFPGHFTLLMKNANESTTFPQWVRNDRISPFAF